jgi:hypothetical protein
MMRNTLPFAAVKRAATFHLPPLRGLGAAHKIEADLQLPFFPNNDLILTVFRFAAWNRAMILRFGLETELGHSPTQRWKNITSPVSKAARYPGNHETHINGGYDNGD